MRRKLGRGAGGPEEVEERDRGKGAEVDERGKNSENTTTKPSGNDCIIVIDNIRYYSFV